MCHKKTRIWYICCKHFSVLSSIITYHRVCKQSNTTGSSGGAGTAYPFDLQFSMQCLVDRCLPFLYFVFWSLCCLSFFDSRCLITSLGSSNSSYIVLYVPAVGFELQPSLVSYSNDSLRIMTEPFRPLGQTHYLKLQLH